MDFKIKYKASREIERYKARLVAKGYIVNRRNLTTQKSFYMWPMVTVRSIVALVTFRSWVIYQMDVHNKFLNGNLLEEVYMHIPQGFARHEESMKVCKLHKSLYGLKQSSTQWNKKLTEALSQIGF